jgi:uncharacterized membrane protein YeaQ/YmgE (transglycosylase-associated protein family)
MDLTGLLILIIIIGSLIGSLTGFIMGWVRERSLKASLKYIFSGILGSFLFGYLANALGVVSGINGVGLLVSLIGAIFMSWLVGSITSPTSQGKISSPPQIKSSGKNLSQPTPGRVLEQERESMPVAVPQPRQSLLPAFAEVERQATIIKQQMRDGILSEEAGKQRLRELMIEDATGNWWIVGLQSGEWYRYDGANWVRDIPPKM